MREAVLAPEVNPPAKSSVHSSALLTMKNAPRGNVATSDPCHPTQDPPRANMSAKPTVSPLLSSWIVLNTPRERARTTVPTKRAGRPIRRPQGAIPAPAATTIGRRLQCSSGDSASYDSASCASLCPPFAMDTGRYVTPVGEMTGTPSGKLNSGGGDGTPHSSEYAPHGSRSAVGPRRELQSRFANMISWDPPKVKAPN